MSQELHRNGTQDTYITSANQYLQLQLPWRQAKLKDLAGICQDARPRVLDLQVQSTMQP